MRGCFRFQSLSRLGIALALALVPALVVADPLRDPGYVVKSGDTLGEVAKKHNVSVEALREANKLDRNDPIKIGQTLSIPAPESSRSASALPGKPVRPGVVRMVRGNETLQTRVLDRRRHLVENTLPEFTRFLRYPDGATHPIDARLARWLLATRDRMASDEFQLTQEFLSSMLGVRREGVSRAAGILQNAGIITYNRGALKILKPAKLEAVACTCYAIIKEN
jgi:murein DD-endopeptidase MepM/ murein hydrolase activator NlpD